MADKTIQELPQAGTLTGEELVLLEQNSEAKKASSGAFIDKVADTVIGAPGFEEQINEGVAEYFDNDPPFFELPSGGQAGQALISDGDGGAEWGRAQNDSENNYKAMLSLLGNGEASEAVFSGGEITIPDSPINEYDSETADVGGYWVNGSGVISVMGGGVYAKIPVLPGETYRICYGASSPTFTSAASGAYVLQDYSGEKSETILPQNLENAGSVNGFSARYIKIPNDKAFLLLTVKLSTAWDNRNTLTVVKAEITGREITSIFGARIKDTTSNEDDVFEIDYGKNRCPSNVVSGYLSNSGSIISGDYFTTDFCFVGDLETVCISSSNVGSTARRTSKPWFLCTYDENKNFIRQVYRTPDTTVYNVESGVYYIRFSNPTSVENIMVERGSTISTVFTEYVPPRKVLKESAAPASMTKKWYNKKWAVVGDSLTEVNSKTTMNYHHYIADDTGIQVVNMGLSGTGYKSGEDNNVAFYHRILNTPLDVDVVTIFGSGNDGWYFENELGTITDSGTETLCGCINTTIDNLYSILPTVQLGIVTPSPWAGKTSDQSSLGIISAKLVEICRYRGIPCLDLFHCSGLRPSDARFRELAYSKDDGYGVHPDETGHAMLAPHFKAFLETLLL